MSNTNKRYNEEFKKQIVELINSGKNINEVVKEYNIARSTVNKWVKDYSSSGSFNRRLSDTLLAQIKINTLFTRLSPM